MYLIVGAKYKTLHERTRVVWHLILKDITNQMVGWEYVWFAIPLS